MTARQAYDKCVELIESRRAIWETVEKLHHASTSGQCCYFVAELKKEHSKLYGLLNEIHNAMEAGVEPEPNIYSRLESYDQLTPGRLEYLERLKTLAKRGYFDY